MKKILKLLGKCRKQTPAAKTRSKDEKARRELSARDVLWESLVANQINAGR